jgi:hypothetical protein
LAKTITIKDDVYERLLKMKRDDESFSDLFERLAEALDPVETLKRLPDQASGRLPDHIGRLETSRKPEAQRAYR